MITSFVTKRGIRLKIGRIPRREIDDFLIDNPEPEAPIRTLKVEVFGEGVKEITKEDRTDPEFIKKCELHYLLLFDKQLDVFAPAIEIKSYVDGEMLEAIYAMGIPERNQHADLLRYIVLENNLDAKNATQIVVYNSTVTQQGIDEANKRFNVLWRKKPIKVGESAKSPAEYSMLYESMRAAKFSNMSWLDFCELTGPEQSELVAFMQMEAKLKWKLNTNQ